MYGKAPKFVAKFNIDCKEMMFYQYLPIKLPFGPLMFEQRLDFLRGMINCSVENLAETTSWDNYQRSYIYLTVKNQFVSPGNNFNREGWHADGFGTDDINYLWSDCFPTVFNCSNFNLTQDDKISLEQMKQQALEENNFYYENNSLLRLNAHNIHKCGEITESRVRTFVKISFSRDKYNLKGNAHNYLLDYNWDMKERKQERNIPQA